MIFYRYIFIGTTIMCCLLWSGAATQAADFVEQTTGMEFVLVRGGSYLMGDIYGNDTYAKPPHKINLANYYVGKYEVTFAQFDIYCEAVGREKPDDRMMGRENRPVINVSREDAISFATWLSEQTGRSFRLPSESEWEYAARGGATTAYWWGNQLGKGNANCRECGSIWDDQSTAPVGSFSPNQYGLHDMIGNVYEWVMDSWTPNYLTTPNDGSASIDPLATEFVSRGGSFMEVASSMAVTARNWGPSTPHNDIGFRLVLEP